MLNALSSGGTHGKDGAENHRTPISATTSPCTQRSGWLPVLAPATESCWISRSGESEASDAVNDPNYAYWHSASFSNDGKKVVFTIVWAAGWRPLPGPRSEQMGRRLVFTLKANKLSLPATTSCLPPRRQRKLCSTQRFAHSVPGRDIEVQAWYQGGISVMDFTDAKHPVEIAYFDRGPIYPNLLVLGGSWSAYWYNGHIYSSEIARGLDIFKLTPTKFLTQNEIDAAEAVRVAAFNVQAQERIEWPRTLVVAKAYVDQLERAQALPADRIAAVRQAIQTAERSRMSQRARKLRGLHHHWKERCHCKSEADSIRLRPWQKS